MHPIKQTTRAPFLPLVGLALVALLLALSAVVIDRHELKHAILGTFRTQNLIVDGQVSLPGTITPPDFTGGATINNYNPTGLATAYVIEQACTGIGDSFISGLQAQPTGTIIVFRNTGYFNLNILNHNSGSLAANQFDLPSATTWQLEPGYSLTLRYTGTQWEVVQGFVDSFFSVTVNSLLNIGQTRFFQPQAYTTTGTSTDVLLNSSTTVFQYIGAGDATITGFAGNAGGRLLIVRNESGHNLTLPNLTGPGSSNNQLNNGGVDIVLVGSSSNAVYIWDTINTNWGLISYTTASNKGTVALAGGTATATVQSGAVCTCTDTTAVAAVQCSVTTTTLTLHGTGTDVIAYICR